MAIGALFHVARLTRPARLRCRPLFVPGLLHQRVYHSSPQTAKRAKIAAPTTTSSVKKKSEREDYEAALRLAQERGVGDLTSHVAGQKQSRLPSLFKFMAADANYSGPSIDLAASLAKRSGETDLDPSPELGEVIMEAGPSSAGPSSIPPPGPQNVPSRKGKERAVDLPDLLQMGASVPPEEPVEQVGGPRRNPVGVQLLSAQMHKQIFPGSRLPSPPATLLDVSKRHLADHGLSPEGGAVLPEISFDLPSLEGGNVREHFQAIGKHTAEPYLSMARDFAEAELPPLPEKWEENRPGWTRYDLDGSTTAVDSLKGETIVSFDVETLYKLSKYPIMATAASPNAWYSWLSPSLFEEPPKEPPTARPYWDKTTEACYPHDLIPLFEGNEAPTIAIGHNVGYDRGRVKEEYSLERTPTRWLDTLSLHVATRGITSVQRPAWMKHRKDKATTATLKSETLEALREEAGISGDSLLAESLAGLSVLDDADDVGVEVQKWEDTTSVNSLAEVAALHCGHKVDKSIRDRFGDESVKHASELRPELQDLLTYCANDVRITHDVYKVVLPLFLTSCPHPASFAGVLVMGNSFLPVDQSWKEYLRNAETMYQDLREDVRVALRALADKLRKEGPQKNDPWTSQLDWTPKAARWPDEGPAETEASEPELSTLTAKQADELPGWYAPIATDPETLLSRTFTRTTLPILLKMSYKGYPVYYLRDHLWCFKAPHEAMPELVEHHGLPVELNASDSRFEPALDTSVFFRIAAPGGARTANVIGKKMGKQIKNGTLSTPYKDLEAALIAGDLEPVLNELVKCADKLRKAGPEDDWAMQLDWTPGSGASGSKSKKTKVDHGTWPKWYWDMTTPPTNKKVVFGELDLTTRKVVAPLLLRMRWQGYPLAYSKQHKWLFRVPVDDVVDDSDAVLSARKAVIFKPQLGDEILVADTDHAYFRIPHKDGEGVNVGNPLSKGYLKAVASGEMSSALADDEDSETASLAKTAINMNALCSYWISSRERIMDQFVVYRDDTYGMILPQVITMGTVTRRAVEATWLTASNAKKDRVGSELKAMVRAPPGYSIVGADVDSEELWISSVMGDSQFGVHGATAIGWMTLEGTKSAGTDLHSKTASILNISRDAAKVFNYSRIYGAGKPHAIQLLLQGDGKLTRDAADELATNLYKATKGGKSFRSKNKGPAVNQHLWHGGSESYLFNTLEAIALMDRPTTPALGCGVTRALRKSFLDAGHSYLPSRINWVVQSSGVDYLHLLIASMEYLLQKYDIKARYLLSVHDEVRYLAKEEDKYRTALALQIANAWTRGLFCYNLGLDDMPQGIAFFSAVDVDHILRKETDMTCKTPSHPECLAPGESLDINQILAITKGDLGPVVPAHSDPLPRVADSGPPVAIFADLRSPQHELFLKAQATGSPRLAKSWLDMQPATGPIPVNEPKTKSRGTAKPRAAPTAAARKASLPKGVELPIDFDRFAAYTSDGWDEGDVADAYASFNPPPMPNVHRQRRQSAR